MVKHSRTVEDNDAAVVAVVAVAVDAADADIAAAVGGRDGLRVCCLK